MTKRIRILFVTALMVIMGAMVPPAMAKTDSAEQVKKETRELIEALKTYGADQRDEAARKTEDAMARVDRRLEALQKDMDAKWEQMDKAARERARETRDALQRQRKELGQWYEKMKSGSAEAWEQLKKGFSDAYEAFYDAWNKADKDMGGGDY